MLKAWEISLEKSSEGIVMSTSSISVYTRSFLLSAFLSSTISLISDVSGPDRAVEQTPSGQKEKQ